MPKILDATTSTTIKSFLPIFYISKYFGCNLYPLPKVLNASNIKTNLRVVDIFFCLIQLGLAFGVSIPMIDKWDDNESPIRKELESIISLPSATILTVTGSTANYGYVIIYLVIMFIDMINAPVIRGILFSFGNFDEEARKQGVKINFSYKYMTLSYVAIILLSHILTIAFAFELLAKEKNGHIGMVFETCVGNVIADGCIYSFYTTYWFFLENVANRMNFINQRLRQHTVQLFNRTGYEITGDSGNTISVRGLSMMHHTLLNIIEKINYCYTSQFVLCTAITFFFSVINFFIFYKTFTLEVKHNMSIMMIFYTCRSFYFNYYFYNIIEVGSRIKRTLKSFSYQLSHSDVEITCGLFPVDWTVFYTILSAMGTYLLWFIQFDNMGALATTVTAN